MSAVIGDVASPALHVMTFNARRPVDALPWRRADRWATRRPRVTQLLQAERPAVAGFQEVLPGQAADLAAALGRDHALLGRGRGREGRGEGCPLAYDHTRLDLLAWEQEALSDAPRTSGSRSWGNLVPRIALTAEFRDRVTGARFAVVNTHLDPFSGRSRIPAARMLRDAAAHRDVPTVLVGDMNAGEGSATLDELLAGGTFRDGWSAADRRTTPEWGTYADYRTPRLGRRRIDWILVTAGIRVRAIGINARRYGGGWPSDHLPVQAAVEVEP